MIPLLQSIVVMAPPVLRRPVPRDWTRTPTETWEHWFTRSDGALRVMLSLDTIERDGERKQWLHLSVSRAGGSLPSWEDLKEVKDAFIGRDHEAVARQGAHSV